MDPYLSLKPPETLEMRKHGSSDWSSPTRNPSAKKRRGSRDECLQLSTVTAESMLEVHSCVSSEIPNHKRPRPPSETSELINSLGRDLSINCLLHCSPSDYGSIACLNQSFRSLIRSGDLYKLRKKMGITEPWIYFSRFYVEWVAYDLYRSRWINLPRIPFKKFFSCFNMEPLVVGTEILVFGMKNPKRMIRYNVLTNSWSSGKEMNFPRSFYGSASFGEKAIIAGGTDTFDNVLNSAELYNSELQAWETLPSMNKRRMSCSGVFMDGKFYIIGGNGSNGELLTCGEEYDPVRRRWRLIRNMSSGLNGLKDHIGAPPFVAAVNNELYAGNFASNKVMKYDKMKNSWITLGELPVSPSPSVSFWRIELCACGENLIVICGYHLVSESIIELYSWIPNEGKPEWNMIVKKSSTRYFLNCAVMSC